MATVPMTARRVAITGCVAFWKATRVLRSSVVDAFGDVGESSLPPIDHYDALCEAGKQIVSAAALKQRGSPVKPDSLSRSGVGVEFYQTHRGDKENNREFLFSIGVDEHNSAFLIKCGEIASLKEFFGHPDSEKVLNHIYDANLRYMPSRDVTDALVGLIGRSRGVPLKETGGVYFIPECSLDKIDAVFSRLNQAGCRCTLLQHDLSDNDELCRQVLEATNDRLVGECQKMREQMEDILQRDGLPRANGMSSRMKSLAQFADLCEYYEQSFGTSLNASREALTQTYELLAELQLRKSKP